MKAAVDGYAAQDIVSAPVIKKLLKDSLSAEDFSNINFNEFHKSRDVRTKSVYYRIGFRSKKISDDFILLKTDSVGDIMKARIIHVQWINSKAQVPDVTVTTSSLNRNDSFCLKNYLGKSSIEFNQGDRALRAGSVSWLLDHDDNDDVAGEQILPAVVVTGYIYSVPLPYFWFWYDGMLGIDNGYGFTFIYGSAGSDEGGGGGGDQETSTFPLDYEYPENLDAIDLEKYLKCFGSIQEADATYTITIATDLPVDGDASKFFNWSNATPGHTYIELYKNGSSGIIQQNIGFYPNSSWKTIVRNSIGSKIVDNANHEYNARYTISVNAEQFAMAISTMESYNSYSYNIASFNCTDFALNVFNAAGGNLAVPKYQIPGFPNGTIGSNTPQGLYIKLDEMAAAGINGVQMPGIKGYGNNSHGPCN